MRKGDTIFLKKIKVPALEEFEKLVEKGAAIAKEQGLKEEDIERIVRKHRKAKR